MSQDGVNRGFPTGVVVFSLDGLRCGIDARNAIAIVPALALRALPGQPSFIAGAFDLHGTPVPVLDLRVRLGCAGRALAPEDRFIVIQANDRLLALWVDEVDEIAHLVDDTWTQSGGLLIGDRSLIGVARTAGGLTFIHDVDAFVAQCESEALEVALR